MSDKRFIYIPSFSVGALASNATKNAKLAGKLSARFWSKDFPEKIRYPYFLLTAGHSYKQADTRTRFGLEDALVFGDSGGFQIVTGAIKWTEENKVEMREKIFNWLETNSDVAMNLDIPPRGNYNGKFEEALSLSLENFEYFYNNQSGKTKFLNVLQGQDYHSYLRWYDAVKKYDFNGWAIGGAGNSMYRFFCGIAVLNKNKEFTKDNNLYLHILGASSPKYFFMMSQLQKSLSDIGSNMIATIDSSSPNIMSKFGTYTIGYDLKRLASYNLHLEKKPENYEEFKKYPLPITCDYDKLLNKLTNLYDMCQFEGEQYIGFVQHNLYMLLKMKDEIDYYVNGPEYILQTITSSDMFKVLKLIDELVKSDNPDVVLERNKPFIMEFDSSTNLVELNSNTTVENSKFFK